MSKNCLTCGGSFPDATTFCPRDGSPLRAAVQGDDLIGEVIAERYLITDLLGEGGMGAVYLASDVRLPQKFAVKVLRTQMASDPSLLARFRQEAEAVCRINHDRVARVFDFGVMPDGRSFIIMEYAAGQTLKTMLEDRGPPDPADAARITTMIAEGLEAAHRLGIVHRDLKPENVMVLEDPGGGKRVKVLDFGIAKLIDADHKEGNTAPGFVVGTPAWMSPEQLLGGTIDVRSDVYSLALLAFLMLTGERAFGGNADGEMMARLTKAPRTLVEVCPTESWPESVEAVFRRTLSRDVDTRPGSALEFAAQLSNAIQEWRPPAATRLQAPKPVPPRDKPRKTDDAARPVKRGLSTTMLATAAAALVVVVAGVAFWPRSPTPRIPTSDDSASPGRKPPPGGVPPGPGDSVAGGQDAGGAKKPDVPGKKLEAKPAGPASGGTRASDSGPTSPPTPGGAKPATPGNDAISPELKRLQDSFDKDESPSNSREVLAQLSKLRPNLTRPSDLAWLQIYVGMAQAELGEKELACAAWERAAKVGGAPGSAVLQSEQLRLALPCRP